MYQTIEKLDELWKDGQRDLVKLLVNQLPELEAFVWYCRVRDSHWSEPIGNQVTIFGSPAFTTQDAERRNHLDNQKNHLCFGRANMLWSTATSSLCFIIVPLRPFDYNRCSYPQMRTSEFYGSTH